MRRLGLGIHSLKSLFFRWQTAVVLAALVIVLAIVTLRLFPLATPKSPGTIRTYYLFATDGYLAAANGQPKHFYGVVGGLQNAPLVYRAGDGSVRTISDGPPAPSAGAITESERALVGQAQYPAPLIWAAAGDLVEIRFKNLGGSGPNAPSDPIGIELRGLNALGQDTAVPETARLAIPTQPGDPQSGNVVVYLFSPPQSGTFAYGAMGAMGDMASMGSMDEMMSCMCCMNMMNSMDSMDMTGMSGSIEMKLDGAFIVYTPGDPAAKGGPGSGAGGELAGQHYDQDWLMVLPLEQMQPQYLPWPPPLIPTGKQVLLRTLNLGMMAQGVSVQSGLYDVIAYRRNPLDWTITRMDTPGWLKPEQLDWQPGGSVLVGAGEGYDWLIAFK